MSVGFPFVSCRVWVCKNACFVECEKVCHSFCVVCERIRVFSVECEYDCDLFRRAWVGLSFCFFVFL